MSRASKIREIAIDNLQDEDGDFFESEVDIFVMGYEAAAQNLRSDMAAIKEKVEGLTAVNEINADYIRTISEKLKIAVKALKSAIPVLEAEWQQETADELSNALARIEGKE